MRVPLGSLVGRRPWVGVGASILLHALLALAVVLLGAPGRAPQVKRGEPLFVELPNLEEPAPRGNPAAREPGAPSPKPAAPPTRPSAPSKPSPPVVAKGPTAARSPAREPERAASARAPEAAPVPRPPKSEDNAPAPGVAKAPAPTQEAAAPEPARPPSAEARTAMTPSPGSSPAPDLRAALRPGGGAGGRGNGRGGIEGEPIPLDSKDPRYSDYLDRVRRRIKEKWGYPCVKNANTRECEYKTAQLVIEFGIAKDGRVPFVNVLRTSGYQIYDEYAKNAILLAQLFDPVPDTMGGPKGIPIVATFSYMVDTSLVNLLR